MRITVAGVTVHEEHGLFPRGVRYNVVCVRMCDNGSNDFLSICTVRYVRGDFLEKKTNSLRNDGRFGVCGEESDLSKVKVKAVV
jgi:hypothetical protein